jgi:ketosteroid isomerase-like protein
VSEENVEIVTRALEALSRRDDDGFVARFHRDCEIHHPPEMPDSGAVYRGVDGVRKWMEDMREVVGMGFGFEPRGHTTGGDVVLIEATARGVGQSSGIPLEFTTFLVFEMRDGKIARAQGFLRRDQALEAAGLPE